MPRLEALADLIKSGIRSYASNITEPLIFWVKYGGTWHNNGDYVTDFTTSVSQEIVSIKKDTGYFEFENTTGSPLTITSLAFSLGSPRTDEEIIDDHLVTIELEPNQILRLTKVQIKINLPTP